MGGVLSPFTGVERVRICLVEGFEQRLEASDMFSSVIFGSTRDGTALVAIERHLLVLDHKPSSSSVGL